MTSAELRFLEHVCASPDDDAPRLIFADWLDEHNDPRGEFIRIQIALARLAADDPRRTELANRESVLLARYRAKWSEPLRGFAGGTEFARGFIETAVVDARTFVRMGHVLFHLSPLRHIRLLDVGSSLTRVMTSPNLARLSAITIFAQHIDDRLTRALVDSPHLDNLRSLNIARNRIGDRGLEQIAWSPRLRNLVELDIGDNAVGDTGVRAIAESNNLGRLQSLELRNNELSRAGLAWLCASSTLTQMKRLGASLNYVGTYQEGSMPANGAVSLATLDVTENGLSPEGVQWVTTLPGLRDLSRLVLDRNEVGNPGAVILARWSGAATLQSLSLCTNRVGDSGARSLAKSLYLHQLVELDLSDNPIHDPGAFEFLNSTLLPRLKRLGLPNLGLTPQIRRALAARYS
jgi:uncharacterized protein (TIGR02996 family)